MTMRAQIMRSLPASFAAAAALSLLAVSAAAAQPARPIPMTNPAVAFLDTAFNQKKPQEAFDKYVGAMYKQHNPTVPDGKEAAIKFMSGVAAPGSTMKYDFKRVLVDGDYVAIHSNIVPRPGDRGLAVIDLFRLEKGKVVEHWDVLQPVPEKAANENGMF